MKTPSVLKTAESWRLNVDAAGNATEVMKKLPFVHSVWWTETRCESVGHAQDTPSCVTRRERSAPLRPSI